MSAKWPMPVIRRPLRRVPTRVPRLTDAQWAMVCNAFAHAEADFEDGSYPDGRQRVATLNRAFTTLRQLRKDRVI